MEGGSSPHHWVRSCSQRCFRPQRVEVGKYRMAGILKIRAVIMSQSWEGMREGGREQPEAQSGQDVCSGPHSNGEAALTPISTVFSF